MAGLFNFVEKCIFIEFSEALSNGWEECCFDDLELC